jgi:hypothetical protein
MSIIVKRILLALVLGALLVIFMPATADKASPEAPALETVVSDIPPQVGEPGGPDPAALAARPNWVPTGAGPGFYFARDYRNDLNPQEYNLAGGHMSFYWDELEPGDDQYDWTRLRNFIGSQRFYGKDKVAIGIVTFKGRMTSSDRDPRRIRVPDWVFSKGGRKFTCSAGGVAVDIPVYWDNNYLREYGDFLADMAAEFKRDPAVYGAIEYIQLGIGYYGEIQPCNDVDDSCMQGALERDGLRRDGWGAIANQIVALYANAFCPGNNCSPRIVLPNGSVYYGQTCERREVGDFAISKGIGIYPAQLYAIEETVDLRATTTSNGTSLNGCGKYDRILDHAQTNPDAPWVPVAAEGYRYMTPTSLQFFWGVVGWLSRHVDYITLERDLLYDGPATGGTPVRNVLNTSTMGWAKQYMGAHLDRAIRSPSAWVILRETGFRNNDTRHQAGVQVGNYSFWLYQDDNISGGRTKPVTYLSQAEILCCGWPVSWVNTNVETGKAFLRGAGAVAHDDWKPDEWKGWIARRTDQASGNRYMRFKVDDRYIYGGSNSVCITVSYLDVKNDGAGGGAPDTWQLVYDAVGNATKVAGTITKTGDGNWKNVTFQLNDARFANLQTGNSDFYIDSMGDGNEYIHMVDVKLGGCSSQSSYELSLSAAGDGWNLVSFPLAPTSAATENVLANIAGKYDLVQHYTNGGWRSFVPDFGGDLAQMNQGMGWWIHMTENGTLTVSGTSPGSTSIPLVVGWNMIGWPASSSSALPGALSSIAGNYDQVWAYHLQDARPWRVFIAEAPDFSSLQEMTAGWGYWIHVTTACTLVVNY